MLPQKIDIPRKPAVSPVETNGDAPPGDGPLPVTANGSSTKRKRSTSPGQQITKDQHAAKRGKLQEITAPDDLVVIDDANSGAIVIDD